ncbi:DUF2783 domain-containing protein [Acidovorax sp.]|uniref:DUF2783 domain-containing protein n=1 Tax=Acidovorax sp. TaxID=1872122 RepID=UPI0025C0A864|nr:DUF2783 domain-containing protein [Acidovorax sp.]MBW8464585.1 DUF2783 domain-containing protein [Acidovorax sp.]
MLNTAPHLQACDDFYEALIAAHQGLTTPESHAMNARLVLLLANHIGDQATLQHALQLARGRAVPTADRRASQAVTPVVPTHAVAA